MFTKGFFLLGLIMYISLGCCMVIFFIRAVTCQLIFLRQENTAIARKYDLFLVQKLMEQDLKSVQYDTRWIIMQPYEIMWVNIKNNHAINWKIDQRKLFCKRGIYDCRQGQWRHASVRMYIDSIDMMFKIEFQPVEVKKLHSIFLHYKDAIFPTFLLFKAE